MAASELSAQLTWLFAQQRFGVKLELSRMGALLERLGHPERRFESVLVGGTNGKGSTVATLASILSAAGRRTGRFTSPHLTRFAERFEVGGAPLSDDALLAALRAVRPHAEAAAATFFEITTAVGCLLFARAGVEVAVMEVGLGGRLDATNALEPRLSLITGVALDHTAVLGGTVPEIAREKAGIMRPGRPCLTAARGEGLAALEAAAARTGAPLWAFGRELHLSATDHGWAGVRCEVASPLGALEVHSPLLGFHQARNVALAVAAAQVLGADEAAIRRGVRETRWPGRLEPLPYRGRTFLLDGAHNPQAARALGAALSALGAAPVRLIFGVAADKDAAALAAALAPHVREVILTRAALSPRAQPPELLAPLWPLPQLLAPTPAAAVAAAVARSRPGEVVAVAGSLYLIGEVRPLLLGEGLEPYDRFQ